MIKSVSQYIHNESPGDGTVAEESATSEQQPAQKISKPSSPKSVPPDRFGIQSSADSFRDRLESGGKKTKKEKRPSIYSYISQRLSFRNVASNKRHSLPVEIENSPTDETYHPSSAVIAVSTASSFSDSKQRPVKKSTVAGRNDRTLRRSISNAPRSDSESSIASAESMYNHSMLVVEITENNVKKYYVVPPGMEKISKVKKLLKKGKKLHIFNEHTFVSTKIPG
ncbi:unnamed protein product [Soboliphyme baturini]|uniref:BRCT domain-containing protein n=1 Tax=Soboliphyme baturini TaxID=241478 RepID=A0A183J1A5_9BILA|nr:unnamed protein product [Soboliphyme baturini]